MVTSVRRGRRRLWVATKFGRKMTDPLVSELNSHPVVNTGPRDPMGATDAATRVRATRYAGPAG